MNDAVRRLDVPGAEARLMRYLEIEGVTGREGAIAATIVEDLKSLGVPELVNHGMPTVTFGAGQYEIHTVKEYVDLAEFAQGCRVAIALATGEHRGG